MEKGQNKGFIRLNKLLAQRGICSRREADFYIEKGQVLVEGEVVSELGVKVDPNAFIELKTKAKKEQSGKVTILLNKPVGFVSTQPEKGYEPAISLITEENQYIPENNEAKKISFSLRHLKRLSVAGRLDIDSKGLLVLSQDGTVVKKLIGPDSAMEKEYVVWVEKNLSKEKIEKLRTISSLEGKPLKKVLVEKLGDKQLRVVLIEGKKRQIRRMCDLCGLKVTGLKRVRIGKVLLGKLPPGKWRYLLDGEEF